MQRRDGALIWLSRFLWIELFEFVSHLDEQFFSPDTILSAHCIFPVKNYELSICFLEIPASVPQETNQSQSAAGLLVRFNNEAVMA